MNEIHPHITIVFDYPMTEASDAIIETCVRGLKDSNYCDIYFSDTKFSVTCESGKLKLVNGGPSRVDALFHTINSKYFVRHRITILKDFKWNVTNCYGSQSCMGTEFIRDRLVVHSYEAPFSYA